MTVDEKKEQEMFEEGLNARCYFGVIMALIACLLVMLYKNQWILDLVFGPFLWR